MARASPTTIAATECRDYTNGAGHNAYAKDDITMLLGRKFAIFFLSAGLPAAVASCNVDQGRSNEDVYFVPEGADLEQHQIPSFDEFREVSRVHGVAEELYLVEWDVPVHSESELREYYDKRFSGRLSKSAVKLTPSTGTDTGQCNAIPTPSNCIDDKFYSEEQLGLRYCVSDDFGANKATIVAAVQAAGFAWQQVANTYFLYDSTNDSACRSTDPVPGTVDFKVAPWSGGGACSYWPYSGRACIAKTLVYDTAAPFAPNTMTGVMTHELGHILGLHHEHMRADAASAACAANEMRYLTSWDVTSIMGYPASWGGCAIGGGNTLSASDGVGARALYNVPTSWAEVIWLL